MGRGLFFLLERSSMMPVSRPTVNPTWVTTARGEAIALLSSSDLVNVRTQGQYLRAYCPIHGSDHQASLSVNQSNGFGVCFCCGVRVLIRELNAEIASRLQHGSASPPPPLVSSRPSSPSPKDPSPSQEWQTRERELLRSLWQSGMARIDRAEGLSAQIYLRARGIPIEQARATGVGYLEVSASTKWGEKLLRRWEDRLLFPLQTLDAPGRLGFAGRLLTGWQQCSDEQAHKVLLEQQGLRRWLKTSPAGWFWTLPSRPISPLIVVEGPFDRLALLSAGFDAEAVVALVGTALRAEDLPAPVSSLLLALDGDQGGIDAAQRLMQHLQHIRVECCLASYQSCGKDWSALWRQHGADGLEALYTHHARLSHNL
jgi:DNA primase